MYVVRIMVAIAIESGNFLPRCGSLVDISETMMLISACIVSTRNFIFRHAKVLAGDTQSELCIVI